MFMDPRTMFLQGLVFAKKGILRKLMHSHSRAPHHQGKVGNTLCERFKPSEKSTAHAPTASHWTLPTLPLGGAGVGYAMFDILARVLDFANAGIKSCSELMVCMQASRSARHGYAGNPKLSFGPV